MSFRLLGKMFGGAMSNGRGEGFSSSRMERKEVEEEYWLITLFVGDGADKGLVWNKAHLMRVR